MKNHTVTIVDDHLLFAQSLKGLVDSFDDFTVLYHATNGQDLVDKLTKISNKPEIILMDINMPVMNGLETTEWLSKNHSEIKVLALSMDDDEKTILNIIKKGARGYLLKDIHPKELNKALQELTTEGFYYTRSVSKALQKAFEPSSEPQKKLSENELKFLKLSCTEKTYKEIAEQMSLSPKTIDGYRDNVFKKLGIKSRVGMVLYAIKHGLHEV